MTQTIEACLTGDVGRLTLDPQYKAEASGSQIFREQSATNTNIEPPHGHTEPPHGPTTCQAQSMMQISESASLQVHNDCHFLPFRLILEMDLLPIRKLFQLRCVCKLWNSMLVGAHSVGAGEVLENEEYWFVMSKPYEKNRWHFIVVSNRGSISEEKHSDTRFPLPFDKENHWVRFPLPLPRRNHTKLSPLIGKRNCEYLHHHMYKGRYHPHLISAGGLMCAIVEKPGSPNEYYDVIVFNCLTGSVKVLPPPLDPQQLFGNSKCCNLYMAIDDRDPALFYIMLTHCDAVISSCDFYIEIFDSKCGCWKVGCSPDLPTAKSSELKFTCADFFFFLYSTSTSNVLAYHAAHDEWSILHVQHRECDKESACLYCRDRAPTFLKHKGRLFQGLYLDVSKFSGCRGFAVWELQPTSFTTATWVEVSRKELYVYEKESVLIRAEGSLFVMTLDLGFEHRTRSYKNCPFFRPPLVYDIAQNLWYELPWMRSTSRRDCVLVHRPRLSMRVPYLNASFVD